MPPSAILDRRVLAEVIGRVEGVTAIGDGRFEARIALAVETTGAEPGQLLNMLFGNASILEDVELAAVELPPALLAAFSGPRYGSTGLKARVGASGRALTCSALKPLGMSAVALAGLASKLARGGLDYIKDDHGLADQRSAPFAERVPAVAAAVRAATGDSGHATRYLPNVSGNLDAIRHQVRIARDAGLDTLLIAPMIVGLAAFHTIVRENADMAFVAHPAMAGSVRIAPAALIGTLFRAFGADGLIYPNVGGRFGYSPETCRAIAAAAAAPMGTMKPALPVPAGGMTLQRIPEILGFYREDAMLLIGGDLLGAGERMTEEARTFQAAVAGFDYQRGVAAA
ncbi:MAG: ribulose 1,5-bisphosphate carboxylase [Hyphomicrobiaceae bacterium]|nr:ribulose 1,5-bisphosphate carboxylase [Hyphomicrobiaceae bacterium]